MKSRSCCSVEYGSVIQYPDCAWKSSFQTLRAFTCWNLRFQEHIHLRTSLRTYLEPGIAIFCWVPFWKPEAILLCCRQCLYLHCPQELWASLIRCHGGLLWRLSWGAHPKTTHFFFFLPRLLVSSRYLAVLVDISPLSKKEIRFFRSVQLSWSSLENLVNTFVTGQEMENWLSSDDFDRWELSFRFIAPLR